MAIKNIKQLRDSLALNYSKMKSNKMPLDVGKELANTAGKILTTCKVELDYNKTMGEKKVIDFLHY